MTDDEVKKLDVNHRLVHAPGMDGIKYQSNRGDGWYTQANLSYTEARQIGEFVDELQGEHDIPDWKLGLGDSDE